MTKAPIQLTKSQRRLLQTALGITMVRGFLAIILGLALFFQPDKSRPMLANFMGMYWLVSGVVSLRWGTAVRPVRRLAILAGTIGVLAGLMTVSRLLLQDYVGEVLIFDLMGVILVLTGLLHIFGGFRTDNLSRSVTWGSFILGIFEVVLGALLIPTTVGLSPSIYMTITIWAFIGGFLILADAWRLRTRLQQMTEMQAGDEALKANGTQPTEPTSEEITH
ncbi:MAG: DUF308 domain-containing protein [Anaerolineales bacterium]|nr:DUF308 domain-containing protein [Anaerolineales bacterium]